MEQKAGAQISIRAFVQSLVILLVLILAAGILTQVVPAAAIPVLAGWPQVHPAWKCQSSVLQRDFILKR